MEKVKKFFSKIGDAFKGWADKIVNLDKKKKIILVVSLLAVLAVIFLVIFLLANRNKGVSMGNINNRGMADGSGNNVFFYYYNTDAENGGNKKQGLYKTSGKKFELLDEQDTVNYINVSGNYVYYVTRDPVDYHKEIVKISKNGKNKTVLIDDIANSNYSNCEMIVNKNKIYFIGSNNKLEIMDTKGENRKQVSNEDIYAFQIVGKDIYYISSSYEIKKMSIEGNDVEEISPTNVLSFQVVGNKIYYLNMNNNFLERMDLDGENQEVVIEEMINYYNITDNVLYFVRQNDENKMAIYKKKLNDDNETKIVDLKGSYTNICVVGKWIYYIDQMDDSYYYYTMNRIKTDGKDREQIEV
ncbi:MAG: DUF5050 domain-containing protein [Clostridia bacterium]|nr:DUF5050 domain-containing protein [Clostridia bacterium]